MTTLTAVDILETWTESGDDLEVNSLDDFHRISRKFGETWAYLFRGMGGADWHIEHSLERAVVLAASTGSGGDSRALYRAGLTTMRSPGATYTPLELERSLFRNFQRHYHHFSAHVPKLRDKAEWYAMMQHHGAPTRWLDWTFAFYVAVFFAVESCRGGACAVYALHRRNLIGACMSAIKTKDADLVAQIDEYKHFEDPDLFNAVFEVNDLNTVVPVNPYRLNQRLIIQQGHFLVPTNVGITFEENLVPTLEAMAGHAKTDPEIKTLESSPEEPLKKIVIAADSELHQKILRSLRSMNVSKATLFPGLDGFCQSLGGRLSAPDELIPIPPQDAWD